METSKFPFTGALRGTARQPEVGGALPCFDLALLVKEPCHDTRLAQGIQNNLPVSR